MTLRIILGVKGTLNGGGVYAGVFSNVSSSNPASRQGPPNIQHQLSSHKPGGKRHSISIAPRPIDQIQGKEWAADGGSDLDDMDAKNGYIVDDHEPQGLGRSPYGEKATLDDVSVSRGKRSGQGVKVTVDQDYE